MRRVAVEFRFASGEALWVKPPTRNSENCHGDLSESCLQPHSSHNPNPKSCNLNTLQP